MIIHFQHGYVAFASRNLISARLSYPIHHREFYQQVVSRGGCSPCVECRLPNDGIVGRRTVENLEGDLLGKLVRVGAYGYRQVMDLTGKTLVSPPNTMRGVSNGTSHSLLILIYQKVGQQRMLAKLPLFTRTRRVLRSAIDRLMTRALSYGWWRRRASSSIKLMVGSLTLVSQGRRLVIWTLCTICKQVFLTFLDELAIILRPTITFISLSGALDRFSARQLGSWSLGRFSLAFSFSMEMSILIPWLFVRITLQLVWLCQCQVVPYLHEDLVNGSVQWGEISNPTRRRSWPSVAPSIIHPSKLLSSVLMGVILPFPFIWSGPLSYHGILSIHVFCGFV